MGQVQSANGRKGRSRARLEHHFEVERTLADRLRSAGHDARKSLYSEVYDELFDRVTDHPQLVAKESSTRRQRRINWQVRYIRSLLKDGGRFAEIGPGDCALSIRMCRYASAVVAIDVSSEITRRDDLPENFSLKISDGSSVPLESESIDLVYSDQLMEHLHPDDAAAQLAEIHRVLRPGGKYLIITPSSALGPHDITKYFPFDVPLGLHLKEYGYQELSAILTATGFRKNAALMGFAGSYVRIPVRVAMLFERAFTALPRSIRRRLIRNRISRPVLNILLGARVLAFK